MTIPSSAGGISLPIPASAGGSSWRIAVIVSAVVSFRNGDLPDSISYSTHPNEKMSVR